MPEVLTPQEIAQARTLVNQLTGRMVVRICDSHEQLRLEREVLTEENERLHASLNTCRKMLEDCLAFQ